MVTDTTYLALLEAIRRDPLDDTVRLVASDRLDELGENARAELIRLQIQLANQPAWTKRRRIPIQFKNISSYTVDYGAMPVNPQQKIQGWIDNDLMRSILTDIRQQRKEPSIGDLASGPLFSLYDRTWRFPKCFLLGYDFTPIGHAARTDWLPTALTEEELLWDRLGQKEIHLVESMQSPWVGSSFEMVYTRGFIEQVRCSCKDFMIYAASIYQQCPTLREVNLKGKSPFYLSPNGDIPERSIWQFDPRNARSIEDNPDFLPKQLYQYLSMEAVAGDNWCSYPSDAAAQTDLSRACIRYAQQQYQRTRS